MHFQIPAVVRLAIAVLTVFIFSTILSALNIRTNYESSFQDIEVKELRAFPKPGFKSRAVILFEASTGTILFHHNADIQIPPASLAKLVVMALALEYLQKNQIPLDDQVRFGSNAWAQNAPARSSLMFLGPAQTCSWRDLLTGLAVDSGNDAAIAIAEQVDGSVEAFVQHMNVFCSELGLKATHFVDSSGYDSKNQTTARDFAYFVWNYLRLFPEAVSRYHSVKEFSYPRPEDGSPIRQYNRNKLLFSYPGADGLKTGFIDESGYNLAFTASRSSMRVAGVILGATSEEERFQDAQKLLNYAFDEYELVSLPFPVPEPIRVWNGSEPFIQLPGGGIQAVLPKGSKKNLTASVSQPRELLAPFPRGTRIAWAKYQSRDGIIVLRAPLVSAAEIYQANPILQAAEFLYLTFRALWGAKKPLPPQ